MIKYQDDLPFITIPKGNKKVDITMLFQKLSEHCGHDVGIVCHTEAQCYACYALNCKDCNEVIISTEDYDLVRKDV